MNKDNAHSCLKRIEVLLADLLAHLKAKANPPLDFAGAAAYLRISGSQLYQLTSKNLVTCYRPGGKKLYFRREDLDAYLSRNRREAQGSDGRPK